MDFPKSIKALYSVYILLLIISFIGSICGEIINNSSESDFGGEDINQTETYNDTFYNQTFDNLNETDISTNLNSTDPDIGVVTEFGNTLDPKLQQSNRYLSFTTADEDICSCDLNSNYCDINCCCDADCNEENMKAFSKCHSHPTVLDKSYCYRKDLILRNNTVFKMVKDPENSLFCIVHDNLKRHMRFNEIPVLQSHRDLDLLLEYQSKFISSWQDKEDAKKLEVTLWKAGSPISIEHPSAKKKGGDLVWKLPTSCFNRLCSCKTDVHYLEDFDSSCSHMIANLKEECESDAFLSAESYIDFCISSHTDTSTGLSNLVAHAKSVNFTNKLDQCTKVHVKNTNTLKPKYLYGSCVNIVNGVHFSVSHNGFYGISDVSVEFKYINISEADKMIAWKFSVKFRWENASETDRRSGNPGYQIGFPILTGTNTSVLEEPFEITKQQNGLSVLDADVDSRCHSERKVVKFGKNYKASCFLKFIKTSCKSIQEEIFSILLGSSQKQVFVGIFGNANGSVMEHWIEAYHEEREVVETEDACHLISAMTINIAYAAAGTVVNPQYKILGVGYHYTKPVKVDLSCSSVCPDLRLSTAVSFFDVTEPAVAHYPKVPSIQTNLPNDFFYPFLYSQQDIIVSNAYLVILLYLVLLLK